MTSEHDEETTLIEATTPQRPRLIQGPNKVGPGLQRWIAPFSVLLSVIALVISVLGLNYASDANDIARATEQPFFTLAWVFDNPDMTDGSSRVVIKNTGASANNIVAEGTLFLQLHVEPDLTCMIPLRNFWERRDFGQGKEGLRVETVDDIFGSLPDESLLDAAMTLLLEQVSPTGTNRSSAWSFVAVVKIEFEDRFGARQVERYMPVSLFSPGGFAFGPEETGFQRLQSKLGSDLDQYQELLKENGLHLDWDMLPTMSAGELAHRCLEADALRKELPRDSMVRQ